MKYSLRTKLSVSYVLITLTCVTLLIVLSNLVLERQFRTYVTGQQQQKEQDTVLMLSQSYGKTQSWNTSAVAEIAADAMEKNLILRVMDTEGTVVWDAAACHMGMCKQMMAHMSSNMNSRYKNWQGGYAEKTVDISYGGQTVGTVNIGYYGPFYYTDADLQFISTLNTLIVWAGVISAALALVIGMIVSGQMSRPIARVIDKARRIADGSYGATITNKTKTKEIKQLVDTVNKLADTLQKQEERSTQASNDIAHELRTPLATMQGNLEAMMDGVMDVTPERLKVLHDEILRINRLVGDLAELARYERREAALHKTPVDLSELVAQAVAVVKDDFIKEGKSLHFEGTPQTLTADRDKLNQVVLNLLSNALKYSRPGDATKVTLTGDAHKVWIKVADTGIGISKADLPYIFERFYRADKSRSRKSGGSGIGLTIVKSVVAAHGGTVEVQSRAGEGTEFTVTLPRQ